MKKQLEHVFSVIAQQCCPNRAENKSRRSLTDSQQVPLLSSENDAWEINNKSIPVTQQLQGSNHWETLELYLDKYKDLHPRLPVIVTEMLLYTDPEIELPLWLVQMFKTNKAGNKISWGMSGKEADPAALFRLYINYGRHAEATNLLVEYLESFASSVMDRQTEISKCKIFTILTYKSLGTICRGQRTFSTARRCPPLGSRTRPWRGCGASWARRNTPGTAWISATGSRSCCTEP